MFVEGTPDLEYVAASGHFAVGAVPSDFGGYPSPGVWFGIQGGGHLGRVKQQIYLLNFLQTGLVAFERCDRVNVIEFDLVEPGDGRIR